VEYDLGSVRGLPLCFERCRYQMTDAALSEAQSYCILHHTVVETGCSPMMLHSRIVPRHATELTAVFLDRKVAALLGIVETPGSAASKRKSWPRSFICAAQVRRRLSRVAAPLAVRGALGRLPRRPISIRLTR
jgi:hypothetical protein